MDKKVYALVSVCLVVSLISVGFAGFTYYRTSQSKATGTSTIKPIPPDLDKTYWDNWRRADSVSDYQKILNQALRYEHNPNSWHSPPNVSIGQGFGVGPYDYVVFQGSTDNYYARSGDNGHIMYEGSNASTVVQNAVDSLDKGCVYLRGFDRPSGVTTPDNVSVIAENNGDFALENGSLGVGKIGKNTYFVSQWAESGEGTESNPYVDPFRNILNDANREGLTRIIIYIDGRVLVDNDAPITNENVSVTIRGTGRQRREIKLASGTNKDMWHMRNKLNLHNVAIDGNKGGQTGTSHGIVVQSDIKNCQWEKASVWYFNGDDLRIENRAGAWQIISPYFESASNRGIHVVGPGGELDLTHVFGGYIQSNDNEGLLVDPDGYTSGTTFYGTRFINNGNSGVNIENGKYPQFYGCKFNTNGGAGLKSDAISTGVFGGLAGWNDENGLAVTGREARVVGFQAQANSQATPSPAISVTGDYSKVSGCTVEGSNDTVAFKIGGLESRAHNCKDIDGQGVTRTGTRSTYNRKGFSLVKVKGDNDVTNVPADNWVTPSLGSEVVDRWDEFSDNQFTPVKSGLYFISCQAQTMATASTGTHLIARFYNVTDGTKVIKSPNREMNATYSLFPNITTIAELHAGDSYEFQVKNVDNNFSIDATNTEVVIRKVN